MSSQAPEQFQVPQPAEAAEADVQDEAAASDAEEVINDVASDVSTAADLASDISMDRPVFDAADGSRGCPNGGCPSCSSGGNPVLHRQGANFFVELPPRVTDTSTYRTKPPSASTVDKYARDSSSPNLQLSAETIVRLFWYWPV